MDLLLAEAAQHLEVHLFVPLCCSTLPCWHPCELPPVPVPRAGQNTLPLIFPLPGSLRSSCKHVIVLQVTIRVDLT